MGYESTIIIGLTNDNSSWGLDENHQWVHEIALYDLSKMGESFHQMKNSARERQQREYFVFTGPLGTAPAVGNDKVFGDMYDDKLVELPLDELLDVLKGDASRHTDGEGRPYRRLPPLIALLESFRENADRFTTGEYERLVVLHYGH